MFVCLLLLINYLPLSVNSLSEPIIFSDKTNQPKSWGWRLVGKHKSMSLGLLAIPVLTKLLGSGTDTLNYNWDCTYANDFPSRLKTPTWAN